jgi:phosphohistidine swiveling domain-containing protein
MGFGLISLDEPDGLRAELVGFKAVRLAEGRRAGLPVLPGICISTSVSQPVIGAAGIALRESGVVAARRIVDAGLPNKLLPSLQRRSRELGPRLVVRSSTPLDDDGLWSGAFASYGDLAPAEVPTGVRGCWASLFARSTMARLAQADRTPVDVGMSVLIQPHLEPQAGGWSVVRDGDATIIAVAGHPGPLFQGWVAGTRIVVPAGRARPESMATGSPLDAGAVATIAELTRHAADRLGLDRMEWALGEQGVVVFQLGQAARVDAAPPPRAPLGVVDTPALDRLAAVLVDRRGRLADELIVPWAGAAPNLEVVDARPAPARDLLRRAREIGATLARTVVDAVGVDQAQIVRRLMAQDPAIVERLSTVTLDGAAAGELLGSVDLLGILLAEDGRLPHPSAVWWQSIGWLESAVDGGAEHPPPAGRLLDPWTDLLFGVTACHGTRRSGVPAAGGRTVGRIAWSTGSENEDHPRPGSILLVAEPLPSVAPLLWTASGLVAATGSPAAHLCEVARSLRVPAVVATDLTGVAAGSIAAVDGDTGDVWIRDP